LEHLKTNPSIDGFASWQSVEEKIKAHLIAKSTGNDWKTKIEDAEKRSCFDGQIGFILEFTGVVDYYQTNKNCDWSNDKEYFDAFVNYAEKATAVFDGKDNYDKDFILERAILTKGIYAVESTQGSITTKNRLNLLHTNTVSNNIARDYSWKRLLRIEDDDKKTKRYYLKEVLDDIRLKIDTNDNIKISLETICNDKTNDWRDYFITYPELMRYCSKGFIKFDSEDKIYLLASIYQGANQYFVEMYTYYLWKQFIELNKSAFEPFKNIDYEAVKSIDEEASIVFTNLCHNRINYEIRIYYCNTDNLPNPYEIAFRKSKGENNPEKYGDDIKNILNQLSFAWNEEYKGFFFTSEKDEIVVQKVQLLCGKLNEL
jgi:hypothetical protein